jgi:hypothetical protein
MTSGKDLKGATVNPFAKTSERLKARLHRTFPLDKRMSKNL